MDGEGARTRGAPGMVTQRAATPHKINANTKMDDKPDASSVAPDEPCPANLAQAAWEQYHGPIIDEGGEEYIPAASPAFMRGFMDGYEQGKKCRAIVEVLRLAEPVMEAWAKSHELEEWHCRVEDLLGTAYPSFMDLQNVKVEAPPSEGEAGKQKGGSK